MRVSDYVVKWLERVTDSVFLLSGGGIMYLVDSLGRSKKLKAICCHHEQGAATAAEGYTRIKNTIGVCLVTTGPGGTNAITGVASAWLDSIPMLVISGQVKRDTITPRNNGVPMVRGTGFQELNVIDLIKPITKYAVIVDKEEDIRFHLEKALYLATSGRPGPVWIEIPLDVQGSIDKKTGEIDPKKLKSFSPPTHSIADKIPMNAIIEKLQKAQRPLLMAGNGIRLAGGEKILWKLIEKLKINVVTPIYTANDLVTDDYQYYLGRQGMWGNTTANYAVDNCDLLLVIGERLQITQTSFDYTKFAVQATKIMVDIDQGEMQKKTLAIDIPVHADAKVFLEELYKQKIALHRWDVSVEPFQPDDFAGKKSYVNVYKFIEELGKHSKNYAIVTANGMAAAATHRSLKVKKDQRFVVTTGLGQMGYALPSAIGISIADGSKPVICIEGDGSIMLNIHELQTMVHHHLPIKIFIYNNSGYYSIRSTHLAFFNKIFAADAASGVSLPSFEKIAKAWDIKFVKIKNDSKLAKIKDVMDYPGPVICELVIDPDQPMPPKWTAGQFSKVIK